MGFVDNVDNGVIGLERDKNHILYIHTVVTARTSRAHAPKGVDDLQLMVHMVHIVHKSTHARTALACWPMVHIVHKPTHGRLATVGRWSTLSTRPRGQGDGTDGLRLSDDGPHCPHGPHGWPAAGAKSASCFQPGGRGRAGGRAVTAAEGLQTIFLLLKIFAIFGPCSKPCHMNRVNCAQPRIA
jgi:hypothetical protein